MMRGTVHIAILILLNLNNFIECGTRRQSAVCLTELHAFAVSKTTSDIASSNSTRICSTVNGCCNKTIENEMKTQASKKIGVLIHDRNGRMKRKFKTIHDDLKAFSEHILQQISESAVQSLQSALAGQTSSLAPQVSSHIRALFKELQSYVMNKDIKMENSTNRFFKNFYPVIYQSTLTNFVKPLPTRFSKCLMDKLYLIKPFRRIPQGTTAMLERYLLPVQVILSGLRAIEHILDVTENVELSKQCTDTLVKMSYCSLCDGFNSSKPCLSYCSDVISRCLEPYAHIQHDWHIFITAMDNLSSLLLKSLDATALFKKLQQKITESMAYVKEDFSKEKVFKHCGNVTNYRGNKINLIKTKKGTNDVPTRDVSNGDLYLTSDSQNTNINLPGVADIQGRLSFIRGNLSEAKTYLGRLHLDLCKTDGLAAPTFGQDKCWIGTGLGKYNSSAQFVRNTTSLKPINNESMMKGALMLLQKMKSEIKRVNDLIKKNEDDYSGDYSGSGDDDEESSTDNGESTSIGKSSGGGSGCDDEDCPEGSGSGETTTPPDAVTESDEGTINTTTKNTVLNKSRSGQSVCQSSLTLPSLLLCYLVLLR